MNYHTYSAAELLKIGETFAARFVVEKGYDTARLTKVTIQNSGILLCFNLIDHFQSSLSYVDQFKHGLEFIDFAEPGPEAHFAAWPGRATRELHVMSRRLGSVAEFRNQLISTAGRAFVEDVIRARDRYLALPPTAP